MDKTQSLPRSATQLLRDSWDVFARNPKRFIAVQVIGFFGIIIPILFILAGAGIMAYMPGLWFLGVLVIFAATAALVVIPIWMALAMLTLVKTDGEYISLRQAFERGRNYIPSYLWILLLTGAVTFGGLMLLVIPGVLFYVWFSFAAWVLLEENGKGMQALYKSREYVRGRFWPVAWRIFFLILVYMLFTAVLDLASYAMGVAGGSLGAEIAKVLSTIISIAVGILWYPVTTAYTRLLYKDLKAARGEFSVMPSTWRDTKYAVIALAGIVLFITIQVLGIVALASLRSAQREGSQAYLQVQNSGAHLEAPSTLKSPQQ